MGMAWRGLLVVGLLWLGGCASLGLDDVEVGFSPLTVAEIQAMHEAGMPEAELIERIQASGTIYRLNSRQVEQLRDEAGLPVPVVLAMEETFENAVAENPGLAEWDRYWFRDDGYWYGTCPLAGAGILNLSCG